MKRELKDTVVTNFTNLAGYIHGLFKTNLGELYWHGNALIIIYCYLFIDDNDLIITCTC